MNSEFEISLEFVEGNDSSHTFRLAFHSSLNRLLLPYPQVTGLYFTDLQDKHIADWTTRLIVSAPLDDFVLSPQSRIAFDLKANINVEPDFSSIWSIHLAKGLTKVKYIYNVEPDLNRYDFLAKRSRFASMTKPWSGSLVSNAIQFSVKN